jgi:hypothetical protein
MIQLEMQVLAGEKIGDNSKFAPAAVVVPVEGGGETVPIVALQSGVIRRRSMLAGGITLDVPW